MKKYILIVLILILACLGLLLFNQYRVIRHASVFGTGHHHGVLTSADAAYIQPWMTFDYIDFAYKLPPTYIQSDLGITNPQYPRISIEQYAAESGQNALAVTDQIIHLVQAYASSTPVTPASSDTASQSQQ